MLAAQGKVEKRGPSTSVVESMSSLMAHQAPEKGHRFLRDPGKSSKGASIFAQVPIRVTFISAENVFFLLELAVFLPRIQIFS